MSLNNNTPWKKQREMKVNFIVCVKQCFNFLALPKLHSYIWEEIPTKASKPNHQSLGRCKVICTSEKLVLLDSNEKQAMWLFDMKNNIWNKRITMYTSSIIYNNDSYSICLLNSTTICIYGGYVQIASDEPMFADRLKMTIEL